ncbi:hypothetical protein [Paenibacillus albilobatus]|uniref:hypothetical protein n=1 Tax=Paenibacillus albilobatus TaxID=2716884 RepID=UPI001BB3E13F|nr:hypothetical protein [Paenibacillus albilobatus]
MSHLVPIQITLQAANAADARQLVQDLAGTLSGMPNSDVPANTEVSALPTAAPANQQQVAPAQPYQPSTPVSLPAPAQHVPVSQPAPTTPYAQPAQQGAPINQPAPTGTVPTAQPTYSVDQLAVAATPLVDAGRGGELIQLLQHFGVQALNQLPPERYGEFATALRGLGAKI